GNRLAQAVLADLSVAEKEGVGTEEAAVVQCLDHPDACTPGGVVGGRGDQRKRVVEVSDLGPMPANQPANLVIRRPAPKRTGGRLEAAHAIDGVVMEGVLDHFVTV